MSGARVAARPPSASSAPGDGSLAPVLDAWWRYAELRARGAPLPERLAAWGALQDERRRHRALARR